MRLLVQLLAGLVFGFGLALADMTSPQRVLGFLDVAGSWDPALMFVLGGAVCTTAASFHFILRRPRPVLDTTFHLSTLKAVDTRLVLGAIIFGIGWGIGGFCPGPGVALLAVPGNPETFVFLSGLAAGVIAAHIYLRNRSG
jgi:uncharacterized membrane protein YedE/YeeE